nr:DNA polymerase III subunit delta [Sedimentibacter sp.]
MSYRIISDLINKDKIPTFVLFYGAEVYLIDRSVKDLKNKYINKDFEDMNYCEFEKIDTDINAFYESVTTLPFISEKKLCVVKESDFLTSTGSINKKDEDKLLNLIEKNYDSCIIVFLIKGGKPDARKKIVKKLKEKNAVFEINKLNETELNKYIIDYFKKHGITINLSDADYISNNSGYLEYESLTSLYDVNNELDKLVSYCMDLKKVQRADIDNLMIISIESNIFKLVDYVCEGSKEKAYDILEEMLLNNVPEQYIIHMITRQYRMLYQYVLLYSKGYNIDYIMNRMKIKKFVAIKLSKLAKNLTLKKIEGYMDKFLEIDRKIKVGEIDKKVGLEIITNGTIF